MAGSHQATYPFDTPGSAYQIAGLEGGPNTIPGRHHHTGREGTGNLALPDVAVVVKNVLGSHFGGFGEFTTHKAYLSGDWDVHWGITGLLTHSHGGVLLMKNVLVGWVQGTPILTHTHTIAKPVQVEVV